MAVDGAATDHALVDIARGWATRLSNRLVIATVAEPVPPSFREGQPLHRARGPADPEGYVADLAARAADASCTIDSRVAYDPISVRDGLSGSSTAPRHCSWSVRTAGRDLCAHC